MNTCHTCGKEFIKVDGSPGDSDVDSTMINDYIMQTDWYRHRKPDWFKVTHPNPWVCRRCAKLLVDNGFSDWVAGAKEFLTQGYYFKGFDQAADNPEVTDKELEELFYEWVLNSNNKEDLRIVINILDMHRPKLARKIALKFLSLLN